jgi:hypothetical protein
VKNNIFQAGLTEEIICKLEGSLFEIIQQNEHKERK